MRILFVVPTLGNGGAERVVTILANKFCLDNLVEIISLEKSNTEIYDLNSNVTVKSINKTVKRGNKIKALISFLKIFLSERKFLKDEVKNYNPDAIISFLPKADFLVYSSINKKKYKWIASERNDPLALNKIERFIITHLYKKVFCLVCQTKKIEEYYKNKNVKQTKIIGNPIIIKNDYKEYNSNLNKNNYFISVGRLDGQKNYSLLIEAFSKAKQDCHFDEKLFILGAGPLKSKLEKQIKKLNMEGEILLLGRKKNVDEYYKNAKAFIMSSDYEGMPNAMLEAMNCGLPIICTNFFSGAAEELIDEENGVLIPVRNVSALQDAIKKIVNLSNDKLEKMGEVSKNRVKNLDVDIICNEWKKVLEI